MRKKIILLGTLALASFGTLAQERELEALKPKVTFGVKIGATFPSFRLSGSDALPANYVGTHIASLYIGGIVDLPIGDTWSIQPGITFVGKGNQVNQVAPNSSNVLTTEKYTPFYIEIPVNLIAKFRVNIGQIFAGAGPYYAYGILGEYTPPAPTAEGLKAGITTGGPSTNVFTSSGSKDLSRTDWGFNFLLGFQLNTGMGILAGYNLGLINIDASSSSKKNSAISIGLSYLF